MYLLAGIYIGGFLVGLVFWLNVLYNEAKQYGDVINRWEVSFCFFFAAVWFITCLMWMRSSRKNYYEWLKYYGK